MSLELVSHPATSTSPSLRVIVADTAAEREQVYALRYDIYVNELRLLPADHPFVVGHTLRDEYDDRSIQLLLLADGEPAGTVRLTPAAGGALELSRYRALDDVTDADAEICEATRLMVRRALRGTAAGPALMVGLVRAMARSGLRVLLAAGKVGNLGRLYQNVGLTRVGDDLFTYDLVGSCRYALLRLDIGAPRTLARLRYLVFVAVFWLGCTKLLPLGAWIRRRGFQGQISPATA